MPHRAGAVGVVVSLVRFAKIPVSQCTQIVAMAVPVVRIERDQLVRVLKRVAPLTFVERDICEIVVRSRLRLNVIRGLEFVLGLDAMALFVERHAFHHVQLGIFRITPHRPVKLIARLGSLAMFEE